jgi:hypothetical protein
MMATEIFSIVKYKISEKTNVLLLGFKAKKRPAFQRDVLTSEQNIN